MSTDAIGGSLRKTVLLSVALGPILALISGAHYDVGPLASLDAYELAASFAGTGLTTLVELLVHHLPIHPFVDHMLWGVGIILVVVISIAGALLITGALLVYQLCVYAGVFWYFSVPLQVVYVIYWYGKTAWNSPEVTESS